MESAEIDITIPVRNIPVLAEYTDEQLLTSFRSGDEQAFTQLVRRYEKRLYNYLLRFLGRPTWAEDVFQETFLQVYISVASFDPNRRFRPWLYTIATNKARDYLRSSARRHAIHLTNLDDDTGSSQLWDQLMTEETTAYDILDLKEQKELVRKVVEQLPDHLRQILILAYFEQLSYKEMADILEIPLGTVKSRLHAAVANFTKRYNELTCPKERNGL